MKKLEILVLVCLSFTAYLAGNAIAEDSKEQTYRSIAEDSKEQTYRSIGEDVGRDIGAIAGAVAGAAAAKGGGAVAGAGVGTAFGLTGAKIGENIGGAIGGHFGKNEDQRIERTKEKIAKTAEAAINTALPEPSNPNVHYYLPVGLVKPPESEVSP